MKRTAIHAVRFLALGAIATVLAAWLLAVYVDSPGARWSNRYAHFTPRITGIHIASNSSNWRGIELSRSGAVTVTISPYQQSSGIFGPDAARMTLTQSRLLQYLLAREQPPDSHACLVWEGRGWPFIAMSAQWPWFSEGDWPTPKLGAGLALANAPPYPFSADVLGCLHALPFKPEWPGFLLDTLLYAAFFAIVPFAANLRRWIRRRRGLCATCAHNLRFSSGRCPECGSSIQSA